MIEADSNSNEDALPRQYTRVSNATSSSKQHGSGRQRHIAARRHRLCAAQQRRRRHRGLPRHRRDRRHHHPRRRRRASGCRPAGLPLGPPGLPDRLSATTTTSPCAQVAAIFGSGTNNNKRRSRLDADRHRPYINGANETGGGRDRSDAVQRRHVRHGATRRRRTGSPRSPISARSRTRPTPGTRAGPAIRATRISADRRRAACTAIPIYLIAAAIALRRRRHCLPPRPIRTDGGYR